MAIIESDLVKLYHDLNVSSRIVFDIIDPLDNIQLFPAAVTRWPEKYKNYRVISTETKFEYLTNLQHKLLQRNNKLISSLGAKYEEVRKQPISVTLYYLLETLLHDSFSRGNKTSPIIVIADEGTEGHLITIEKLSATYDYKRALRKLKERKPRNISGLEFLSGSRFQGSYADNGATIHLVYPDVQTWNPKNLFQPLSV